MIVLDENIGRDQADLLVLWGIRFRSLSRDIGAQGISDENIPPLLLRLKKPTMVTRDLDFFKRPLIHSEYSLVFMDVHPEETAFFIKKFIRDRRFDKSSSRLGKVFRVHHQGIDYFCKAQPTLQKQSWGSG